MPALVSPVIKQLEGRCGGHLCEHRQRLAQLGSVCRDALVGVVYQVRLLLLLLLLRLLLLLLWRSHRPALAAAAGRAEEVEGCLAAAVALVQVPREAAPPRQRQRLCTAGVAGRQQSCVLAVKPLPTLTQPSLHCSAGSVSAPVTQQEAAYSRVEAA